MSGQSTTDKARNGPALWDRGQRLRDGQECLAAALEALARGWSVLALCPPDHDIANWHTKACKSPGKAPWHKWKQMQERLPTEAEVRDWWRNVPTSNVGLALGEISGLVRVDVDGPGGEAKLAELSEGNLPPSLEFTRGDLSRGLLYAIPPGTRVKTTPHKQDGDHQELRLQANGAQTVLPPSRHPGRGALPVEAGARSRRNRGCAGPPWLLEALRPDKPKKPGKAKADAPGRGKSTDQAGATDRELALSALAGLNRSRAVDYDSWLQVGQCLHSADPGLLSAWDDWSRSCPEKYQEGLCAEKWASFHANGGLTLRTLLHWAAQDGWTAPRGKGRPSRSAPPGGAEGAGTTGDAKAVTGYDLIVNHFKKTYQPVFRRGSALYSALQGREVRAGEACYAPGKDLAEKLMTATDAPRDGNGPRRSGIPQFFRTWAGSAWKDILDSLPEEEQAGEVSHFAEEQFRAELSKAMKRTFPLGFVSDKEQRRETRLSDRLVRLLRQGGGVAVHSQPLALDLSSRRMFAYSSPRRSVRPGRVRPPGGNDPDQVHPPLRALRLRQGHQGQGRGHTGRGTGQGADRGPPRLPRIG